MNESHRQSDNTAVWLLDGPPWVRYKTRLDLLGQAPESPEAAADRREMLASEPIRALLADLADWPGRPIRSHNDAGHPIHKLTFVADLGLTAADPDVAPIVERALANQSAAGAFQTISRVPTHFGGSGEDELGWMLCDAPLVLAALLALGVDPRSPAVDLALSHLASLASDDGWPCVVAPNHGRFRGPGRKADPCPYATLIALQALSLASRYHASDAARAGAEALLGLWTQRRERRPYLFAMGSGFARLKAPLVWYDILHVTEVLTRFPWLRADARLGEMVGIVRAGANADGRFTPASVWSAWNGWDFGQKREPSRWLTFVARRMIDRFDGD